MQIILSLAPSHHRSIHSTNKFPVRRCYQSKHNWRRGLLGDVVHVFKQLSGKFEYFAALKATCFVLRCIVSHKMPYKRQPTVKCKGVVQSFIL